MDWVVRRDREAWLWRLALMVPHAATLLEPRCAWASLLVAVVVKCCRCVFISAATPP